MYDHVIKLQNFNRANLGIILLLFIVHVHVKEFRIVENALRVLQQAIPKEVTSDPVHGSNGRIIINVFSW